MLFPNLDDLKFFENLGEIGSGSFGVVQVFYDIRTKIKYAVKKISTERVPKLDIINEIQTLNALINVLPKHEGIIEFHGYISIEETNPIGHKEEYFLLFCELANGSLKHLILNKALGKAVFEFQDLLNFIKTLISVFVYLQIHGITHRDLKPQNILYILKEDKNLDGSHYRYLFFLNQYILKKK